MLETQDIINGKLDGQKIWICDLRYNDYSNKPVRHVIPMEVFVVNKDKVNKKIYYSNSCFLKINKNGEAVNSAVIPLFDNTGFRSYTGEPVKCFDNKEECIDYYKKQAQEAIKGLSNHLKDFTEDINDKIQGIKNLVSEF